MNEARKEESASLWLYKIRNVFDYISFLSTNKYGIYGATSTETLKMFHLGIFDYPYKVFITKLNGDTRKNPKIS